MAFNVIHDDVAFRYDTNTGWFYRCRAFGPGCWVSSDITVNNTPTGTCVNSAMAPDSYGYKEKLKTDEKILASQCKTFNIWRMEPDKIKDK